MCPLHPSELPAVSSTLNRAGFAGACRSKTTKELHPRSASERCGWQAITSAIILPAGRCGVDRGEDRCVPQTLYEWVKRAEVDSGKQAGVATEVADKVKALEREVRELRQNKNLRRHRHICADGARPPVTAMGAFIDDHRDVNGVEPVCRVLPIAPSTYHERVAEREDPTRSSARARQDAAFKFEISRVFAENLAAYEAQDLTADEAGGRSDRPRYRRSVAV